MFGFLKKKCYLRDSLQGLYDIHSHLLWGVDDGCRTAEESVEVAGRLRDMGMKGAVLTPHIIYGIHGSRSESDMVSRMEEMPPLGDFEVRLAAEYYLDEQFLEHINNPQGPLTMGDDWLLVEYGMGSMRADRQDELFEVALSGKNIIVAHPERYAFAGDGLKSRELKKLTAKNYSLQLNILSLSGYYGDRVRKVAEELLLGGAYSFVGTDTHNLRYVKALEEGVISPKVVAPLAELVVNNARQIWKK